MQDQQAYTSVPTTSNTLTTVEPLVQLMGYYFAYCEKIAKGENFDEARKNRFVETITKIKNHPDHNPTTPLVNDRKLSPFEVLARIKATPQNASMLYELFRQTARIHSLISANVLGNTPLMCMVIEGNRYGVQTLFGFNYQNDQHFKLTMLTQVNRNGDTPLRIAMKMRKNLGYDADIIDDLIRPEVKAANLPSKECVIANYLYNTAVDDTGEKFLGGLRDLLAQGHNPNKISSDNFLVPAMHLAQYYTMKPGVANQIFAKAFELMTKYEGDPKLKHRGDLTPHEYAINKMYNRHAALVKNPNKQSAVSRSAVPQPMEFKLPLAPVRTMKSAPGQSISTQPVTKNVQEVTKAHPVNYSELETKTLGCYSEQIHNYLRSQAITALSLHDDQITALRQIAINLNLNRSTGFVDWPTGRGKTRLAIALINALNESTLFIVPTVELLNQTKDRLQEFCHGKEIGVFYGKTKELKAITITTYASLNELAAQNQSNKQMFRVVIADECHHALSAKAKEHLKAYKSKAIILGLTATIEFNLHRSDACDTSVITMLEHCHAKVNLRNCIKKGDLSSCQTIRVILPPCYDSVSLDRKLAYERNIEQNEQTINALNTMIVNIYANFVNPHDGSVLRNKQGIVFGGGVKHCQQLAERFNALLKNHGDFYGKKIAAAVSGPLKEQDERQIIQDYKDGKILILVGDIKLREGFSAPNTQFIISAIPTDSSVKCRQGAGRALHSDANLVQIIEIDFYSATNAHYFSEELGAGYVLQDQYQPMIHDRNDFHQIVFDQPMIKPSKIEYFGIDQHVVDAPSCFNVSKPINPESQQDALAMQQNKHKLFTPSSVNKGERRRTILLTSTDVASLDQQDSNVQKRKKSTNSEVKSATNEQPKLATIVAVEQNQALTKKARSDVSPEPTEQVVPQKPVWQPTEVSLVKPQVTPQSLPVVSEVTPSDGIAWGEVNPQSTYCFNFGMSSDGDDDTGVESMLWEQDGFESDTTLLLSAGTSNDGFVLHASESIVSFFSEENGDDSRFASESVQKKLKN